MADELDRWLSGEPILARPQSAPERLKRLARKRRWPIITAVCAAAAILLTLAALLPGWRAGRRESERQIAALVEAEKRREVMQELNRLWTQVVAAKEWTRQGFRRPEEIRTAFARAEADLNAFIAQNAGLAPAHYVRGRARLYWGAIDGAEADARETVRLDPEIPAGWALLSHVLLRRCLQCLSDPLRPPRAEEEPLAQAVAALRRAGTDATRSAEQRWGIARGPDDEVGDVLIAAFAEAYAYGQATHGAAILAEAMARGNSEEYCRWMGAWTTAPQGRLAWCDRLLAIAPHDAAGYLDRGHARMELGELASAVEDFTRALAIDPELHRARINRAEARFAAGEADAGMLDLAQVIAEARPAEAAAAHFNRSLARSRMRDLTGAIADCSAAVRLRPDFSRAWATRAAFRMRVGDATGAEADCEQALAVDPRCAIAYINRGSLRGNRGNHSGAVADYSAAIEIDPKNAMAWAERGAAHRDIAAYAAAREDASRALELDPACATAYFVRGAARRHLADLDGAIEDLARFVAMESDSAPGWGELGHAKQLKGDREGAASDFKRALSVAPAGWAGRRVMERLLRQVESAGS
jgi:tetratricopeptide (TPR) repeat protein